MRALQEPALCLKSHKAHHRLTFKSLNLQSFPPVIKLLEHSQIAEVFPLTNLAPRQSGTFAQGYGASLHTRVFTTIKGQV